MLIKTIELLFLLIELWIKFKLKNKNRIGKNGKFWDNLLYYFYYFIIYEHYYLVYGVNIIHILDAQK